MIGRRCELRAARRTHFSLETVMNCPQCHSPMDPKPKAGWLSTIHGLVTGSWTPQPQVRCPNCSTEVSSPTGGLVLYIDNLEDYRKNLVLQESHARPFGTVLAGFAPELPADHLPGIQRRLRILDAMTLDERLDPDRIGPAERERITNDGD